MPEGLPQPSSPCSATSRTIWPSSVACRRIPSRPTGAIWSSWPRSSHGTTPPGRRPYPILRRFLAQQHTLGYARATIARRVGAIKTFYRWAVSAQRVPADPSLLLGRPKVVHRLPTVLRPNEAEVLAEAPPVDGEGDPPERAVALRDRATLELLYGSGLRVERSRASPSTGSTCVEAACWCWGRARRSETSRSPNMRPTPSGII